MIAKSVMAIAEMSPRPHHAVCAFFKCPEYMRRADPAGTHHPDKPHVSRILHPAHPGSIRSGIRAPVAGEDDDSWVEIVFLFFHFTFSLQSRYGRQTYPTSSQYSTNFTVS
jgi:hypothetical protein